MDEIKEFVRYGNIFTISSGMTFIHEGDEDCDAAYVLISGALQIYATDSNRNEIVLNRIEPLCWVGELGLLDGGSGKRNASVRADGACEVLRIDRANFRSLIERSPALREKLSNRYKDITQSNIAKRSQLFRLLSEQDAASGLALRFFKSGELVFAKGAASDSIHYILLGEAELTIDDVPSSPSVLLGPDECFGQQGLLAGDPRRATVRAASELTTLAITDGYLRYSLDPISDPPARDAFMHLNDGVRASVRGIQYLSSLGGEEIVERVYYTEDGRVLRSTFSFDAKAFRLVDIESLKGCDKEEHVFGWSDPLLGKERHVTLDASGHIICIRSSGDWSLLPRLIANALAGEPLTIKDFAGFASTGSVQTAHLVQKVSRNQIVCHCVSVDQNAINAAIAGGCSTLDLLRRETGCGSICGGCLPSLKEWFGGRGMIAAVARRFDCVPGVTCLQLYPREGNYPVSAAGQHILIESLIADRWVTRSYTITSPACSEGPVEITVKREPKGCFSSWLFEGAIEDKLFRISEPTGNKTWESSASATVCVVAGIGVTPAIAILRTMLAQGKRAPLHIDYSINNRDGAAFVTEIEHAAAEHPSITCTIRDTSRYGRISDGDISGLTHRFEDAFYHLCGPPAFVGFVEGALMSNGIVADAIKTEVFVHSGKPHAEAEDTAPFLSVRGWAYVAAIAVLLSLSPLLVAGWDTKLLSIGPATPGHESLACIDCHQAAVGTIGKQLLVNGHYLLNDRSRPVDFLHRPVTTGVCVSCHDMGNTLHAPVMFLEPRYQQVRDILGPDKCSSCHREHDAIRVSLNNLTFCRTCHETVVINNDPLDVSHEELASTGKWESCMGCHDYHGNHRFRSQTLMSERFLPAEIRAYFGTGPTPYGAKSKRAKKNDGKKP